MTPKNPLPRNRLIARISWFLLATVLALVAASWVLRHRLEPEPEMAHNTVQIGGPFTLVDQDGQTVSDRDFRGRLMLIYFGYTFCPDVCPMELQVMSAALDELGAKAEAVQPLFITVDPERDTAPVLAEYLSHFHPRFRGLTGTPEQIRAVTRAYHVYYARAGDEDDYLMDHSSIVFLMGRDGRYLTHFGREVAPEAMAAKIAGFIDRSGG